MFRPTEKYFMLKIYNSKIIPKKSPQELINVTIKQQYNTKLKLHKVNNMLFLVILINFIVKLFSLFV